jgi:hypothetical protein
VLANGDYVVASPNFGGAVGAATFGSGTTGVTGTITAQNSILSTNIPNFGSGSQFGSYIQDNPVFGTFVVSGVAGSSPVIESAGSAQGINSLLGNANQLPGQSITISPAVLENALAGGNTVRLAALNSIFIESPFSLNGGTLALSAGNEIVFGASVTGNTPFILTARALSADVAFTQADTTLDGVPFQGPLIPQMRTMVDGITAPSTQPAPAPYGVVMGQYCAVVRPDGSCEREEATTPNESIAARGNAYLGDLLYRR